MNLGRLAPWNWFKREDEIERAGLPIRRDVPESEVAQPLEELHRGMDRLFDHFFREFSASAWSLPPWPASGLSDESWLKPRLDITSRADEYRVTVELPGVQEDDVQIDVSGDTLRIRGEKKQQREENERDYHCVERTYGSFQRLLSLPRDADVDGIGATFKRGVMTIRIPRRKDVEPEVKRIELKSG